MNRVATDATKIDAINAATIDFLLSPAGRAAARELAQVELDDTQTLAVLQALRRSYTPPEAGALLALARVRRNAQTKFADAHRLFFTQEALEQATTETVAAYRAAWIADHAPPGPVLDLGCGIGGDTLALARRRPVIAYERDPVRLRCAQANVAARDLTAQVTFHASDWTAAMQAGHLPPAAAAFVDPARRQGGRRLHSLHRLIPPLAALLELQKSIPAVAVKVMPGVRDAELPAMCGVEFISHGGVCKEAVLWFGPLAQHRRSASVHRAAADNGAADDRAADDGEVGAVAEGRWHKLSASGAPPPTGPLAPGMVLYEPDPAVIRAGAFAELCAQLQAHLFDAQIAYLVSNTYTPNPYVRSFVVHEVHPFGLKLLNQRLQALQIGQVELKKRGAPFAPESLRGRLRLPDSSRAGVVFFTRQGDQRLMLIAERKREDDRFSTDNRDQ